MGLFNKTDSKNSNSDLKSSVITMIQDCGKGFYSWNGKLYQSDIVRACIKPKTKAIGKCVAKHIRETMKEKETKIEVNPLVSIRFLLEEPNALMSGQMMQEKVANQLALNGNAFVLILRDPYGTPIGLYPIPCASVEFKLNKATGQMMLKFYYINGKYSEFPYEDIIQLRDDYFDNDVFGESPQQALTQLMNTVSIIDQGIGNAIKNSAVIKWLLKFTSSLRDDDLKVKAQEFADNYLSISNNRMGVAAVDSKAEIIQVANKDYVPNAAQTDRQTERIYAFFNTNKKIVTSSYNEDEWISYYEACIEPVVMQMSNEYTRKLFSRRERGCGNKIIFESSALTFASMSTKLNLVGFVDRGIMTPNEVRRYFNLEPLDGGDLPLLRKDTEERTTGGNS